MVMAHGVEREREQSQKEVSIVTVDRSFYLRKQCSLLFVNYVSNLSLIFAKLFFFYQEFKGLNYRSTSL